MKSNHRKSRNQQSGQLLIHLAEIFVSAGLIVGVAMQGDVYLENYQYQAAYEDLRHIENEVWAFKERNDVWPTECNASTAQPSVDETFNETCQREAAELTKELHVSMDKNAESAGWNREFVIQTVVTASSEIKHAIVLKNVDPQLASWLDRQIDGAQSLPSGRILSGEFIPSLVASDLVYLFESQI